MENSAIQKGNLKKAATKVLPWALSLLAVLILLFVMLLLEGGDDAPEDSVTVRRVDVTLPPPPKPPPPLTKRPPESENLTPSIDLIGPSKGPALNYANNPKLTMINLEKVKQPDFDPDSMNLQKTLSVDFPLLEVKELDQIPRLVSTNRISFPKILRQRGINRVETLVEIIIDQNGKAFVKKIVDPVYPEMVDVIRKSINNSRFTVPTKNGLPVQAVYLYTLRFIYGA
jgi:periplasmic protein TonB